MKPSPERLLGMVAGAVGGFVASRLFHRLWAEVVGGEAPEPTDVGHSWAEVLAAAALQGALFAVVRAATQRGGAVGYRKLTASSDEGEE